MVRNVYGLILCGGKSARMKKDKALLSYHGQTQVQHTFALLKKFCTEVFISIRRAQAGQDPYVKYDQIPDQFDNVGPLAGIMAAFEKYPDASWLVLASDLPFVTEKTIDHLLKSRDSGKMATAYKSTYDDLPEPLCAVYEPAISGKLREFFDKGNFCPRKLLMDSSIHLIDQIEKRALDNINTPDEHEKIIKDMERENE